MKKVVMQIGKTRVTATYTYSGLTDKTKNSFNELLAKGECKNEKFGRKAVGYGC